MAQAPAPAATLASLPHEVATAIMRHVPLEQRLGPCARVCRALAAAAAAATDDVDVFLSYSQQRADALSDWLVANGSHVVRLVLHGTEHLKVRLPAQHMAQLQELLVLRVRLVEASSASASLPQGLTRLSRLRVDESSIASTCASLQPLSALSGLRQLSVEGLFSYEEQQRQQQQQQALGQLLAHATQLTLLVVDDTVQAAALAGLGALDQLQELVLPKVSGSAAAWLPALPGGLTKLRLPSLDCSGSAADRLAQLTALRALELPDARQLRPALLSSLVGLRRLDLTQSSLAGGEGGGAVGLLAALAPLTQLEELQLSSVLQQPAAPVEQYAALTASSQLTALRMLECELPAGAGQHMFGQPGRMLPRLEQLNVSQPGDVPSARRPFSQAGLDSLVACCPGLQMLDLTYAVAAGVQLTPLAQLSALSRLWLGGSGAVSSSMAAQLAACTGLRRLCVCDAPGLCDVGALSFTSLRQLEDLELWDCGLSEQLRDEPDPDDELSDGEEPEPPDALTIYDQADGGEPPDVWRQLRERCRRSPACAAVMLQQAEERSDAQAAQLELLEARLAQLERLFARQQQPAVAPR